MFCNIRPKNWCSFFLLIFVLFGVLQHPARELMFIFPANFRTFRCSATSGPRTDGDFSWYLSYFSVLCNIRPKNWCSFFLVLFVLFGALQHPAQELMVIFRGTFRAFRCSATSGPRTDAHITHRARTCCSHIEVFFPKQCGNTWGSYGSSKKPGWLDRGGGRVAHRFHRYFRGFVLACSFRLWIFVVFGWRRPTRTGFVCKFS